MLVYLSDFGLYYVQKKKDLLGVHNSWHALKHPRSFSISSSPSHSPPTARLQTLAPR
uniref:Uncharacterized protein n=1 Tax=Aegilops tauschii subsp. strangulata TaxID=200361 RepID=A0A453QN00_AEGTS